jgi:hypothetical protein
MRASLQRMADRRTEVIAALKQARDLIAARGYQPYYGSANEGGPINISNALTRACGDYETYLLARQSFSSNWGGPIVGLVSWETERRRTVTEVMDLFARVLKRLDDDEAHPTGSAVRSRRPTSTA